MTVERTTILDCTRCRSIPHRLPSSSSEREELLARLVSLPVVWCDSAELDRYTTARWELATCPDCQTYYWHYDYCDEEDAFAAGPQVVDEWSRCSSIGAQALLTREGYSMRSEELRARHGQDVAAYTEALETASQHLGDEVLDFAVRELVDDLIARGDWRRISAFLLEHGDRRVRVAAAARFLAILDNGPPGRGGYGSREPDVDGQTFSRAHTIKQRNGKVVSTLKKILKRDLGR